MSATRVQTEKPEKFLVRNNTAGFVGVIEIDSRGDEHGINIEPQGARWMTEDEMIATARAPRLPEDNPFEEQTLVGIDPETQRRKEFRIRLLTLERDSDRFVPSNERYVPTVGAPEDVAPAPAQESATAPPPVAAPRTTGSEADQPSPTPVASQGAPVPPTRTVPAPRMPEAPEAALSGAQVPAGGAEQHESWTAPPEAPGEVITGTLAGSDDGDPEREAAAAPQASDAPTERFIPTAGQTVAAPQTPGQVEEHAEAVDQAIGEETGAARPPDRPQPEGEYAQAEEVGSPDAPEQGDDSTPVGG